MYCVDQDLRDGKDYRVSEKGRNHARQTIWHRLPKTTGHYQIHQRIYATIREVTY